MQYELTADTTESMVQAIDPDWQVRAARPAPFGRHIVSHLTIETATGTRELVLKATPPDMDPVCGAEARILAILDSHTRLPVPTVIGVVDEHETFPAPFFLATKVDGTEYSRYDVGDLPSDSLESIAHSIGRHLHTLHDFDAVDSYGFVTVEPDETLRGGQPSDAVSQLRVHDGDGDWRAYLQSEAEQVEEALQATRFDDLASRVRAEVEARIERLSGEFSPALARIDQSLEHALVDPAAGGVSGLIDWEFTMATAPGYDLVFVEHSLAGGHWSLCPDTPDRRTEIRAALHDGYRAAGGHPPEPGSAAYECYDLFHDLHAMLTFESWFENGADDEAVARCEEQAAAATLREQVVR